MRNLLPLLLIGFSCTIQAEVMIFNKTKYDIHVSYKYCSSYQTCDREATTVTVHGSKNSSDSSYIVLNKLPPTVGGISQDVYIASAVEVNGKEVIATNYYDESNFGDYSGCFAHDNGSYIDNNGSRIVNYHNAIILDNLGSSKIICQLSTYGSYTITTTQ